MAAVAQFHGVGNGRRRRGGAHLAPGFRAERTQGFLKTKLCKFYILGECQRGGTCAFAHQASEMQAPPDLSRTKLCRTLLKTGRCEDLSCMYAHNREELREMPIALPTRSMVALQRAAAAGAAAGKMPKAEAELFPPQGSRKAPLSLINTSDTANETIENQLEPEANVDPTVFYGEHTEATQACAWLLAANWMPSIVGEVALDGTVGAHQCLQHMEEFSGLHLEWQEFQDFAQAFYMTDLGVTPDAYHQAATFETFMPMQGEAMFYGCGISSGASTASCREDEAGCSTASGEELSAPSIAKAQTRPRCDTAPACLEGASSRASAVLAVKNTFLEFVEPSQRPLRTVHSAGRLLAPAESDDDDYDAYST